MSLKRDEVQVTVLVDGKQAINQLGRLEMEARDIKEEMKGLKRTSDEYIQASARLEQVKARMKSVREELGVTGMTMNQLRSYQRQLMADMNSGTTRGTAKYEELKAKLIEVNGAIRTQRDETRGLGSVWGSLKQSFSSFGAGALVFTAVQQGLQLLSSTIGSVLPKNAELSDAFADVKKNTGLTKQEVHDLNEELASLNTRTSQRELLKLASDAGKLGIEGKQDVLEFVKAADKINVALGEDLGEDAIKSIGKLNDLFGIKDIYGYGEGMQKTGSAINELGSSSTASEAYLVDFTKRLGGVGKQAGVSLQDILGMGAALDSLGQTSETSSTAIGTFLVDMFSDTATYAGIAGIEVGAFTTLLNEDANQAFIAVLQGLQGNNEGFATMVEKLQAAGIEGARATQVISTLSGNIQVLTDQQRIANQAFADGTSLTNEFNTKNQTLAASIEKIGKFITNYFVNSQFVAVLERFAGSLAGLIPPTETAQESLEGLRSEFNREIETLKRGNFTQEERARLIQEINSKYGQYLPHLLSEQSSLEDIEKAQRAVNEAILGKIILMDFEEEITELYKRQKESAESLYQTEKARQQLKLDNQTGMGGMSNGQLQQMQQMFANLDAVNEAVVAGTGEAAAEIEEKYEAMAARLGLNFQKLREAAANAMSGKTGGKSTGGLEEQLGLIEQIQARIEALQAKRDKSLSVEEIRSLTAQIEAEQQKLEELVGSARTAAKNVLDLKRLEVEAIEDATQRRIQQLILASDKEIEEVEKTTASQEEKARAIELIQRKLFRDVAEIQEEAFKEELERLKKHEAEKQDLINRAARARAELGVIAAGDNAKAQLEAKIAQLDVEKDIELQNTELIEEERQLIRARYAAEADALREEYANQDLDRWKRTADETGRALIQASTFLHELKSAQRQAELDQEQQDAEARMTALEAEFERGTLRKREFEKEKAKLEKETALRQAELKLQQAKADKEKALFDAGIATALAVLKAAPNPILMAAMAAVGAIQVATIAAKPLPAFAEGGKTGPIPLTQDRNGAYSYKPHSIADGGTVSQPYLAWVGERGAEYIVPNWMLHDPWVANVVGIMESMRTQRYGPAARIKATGLPAFAEGGGTGPLPAGTSGVEASEQKRLEALFQAMLQEQRLTRQEIATMKTRLRAYIVWQDLEETQDTIDTIYNDAAA
ncbi:phage tail tape measure protein, TP901 family, core region [Catalinimonas alkaloidigena]|uniref:Phage tail tape measure protein, TP901 family, core region n=1 Tax=Catalinimonas alkaloidigena TaxID=1075417 RepID=A0A1G9B3T1_9BACT|nr:phage tail tape measure protein [Catalinimonas alkaloidigena]SDK34191.1 phage tail tape measure protein, TP901 family, core region [Catalinimonas alkaloidigena]